MQALEVAEAINGKNGLATKEDLNEVKERMGKLETSNKWVVSLTLMVLGTLVALLLSTIAILLKLE